jgi:hypothetical protein
VAAACDYMAVRFGTLSSDFLCGLISGASRTCAWITRSVRRRAASFSRATGSPTKRNAPQFPQLWLVGLEGADHGK